MVDRKDVSSLDLGLQGEHDERAWLSPVEIIALLLSLVWLAGVGLFLLYADLSGMTGSGLETAMFLVAIFVPLALIWVAASAAKTARVMRDEAARLQSAIDAMRAAYIEQQQKGAMDIRPAMVAKLDEIAEAQRSTETALATFTSVRAHGGAPAEARAAVAPEPMSEANPQPSLGLGTPAEAMQEPISVADFIKALNFPENEHDKEGFRTLRRALEDVATQKLIRASQDVLTLLSQDGIYMDDLRPDRARPELWRKFAQGERGKAIAGLGGIRDRSSLALSAGRMKQDTVFRDAVHHFLRQFDRTLVEFDRNATDEEIVQMAETRTARAFMLLGRVTGTFD